MAKQGHREKLTRSLLAWYAREARDLPWRAKPGEPADPYRVWLSEIMLQQTTAAAVRGYYAKFLGLWPDISALAAAPLDDVLRAWAGLGYYARVRNLHACARMLAVERGGRFPETEEGLRALPGIGPYTAAAIAAIAFGRPHAAVDGNAERVIARLYAIETPLPAAKPEIRKLTQALVPEAHPGDFAQALMDLGATVCTPRRPSCHLCPWTDDCLGRRKGLAETLPRKAVRRPVPTRKGVAFWIERGDGAVLLRRRPEKGLLGGMLEIPSTQWTARAPRHPEAAAPLAASWRRLSGKVEHTFTHFHLELAVLKSETVQSGELPMDGDYRWVRHHDLGAEALPTLMRKVVALALA
ncbi:MAG TPA: A/G-specific adenine glycosylase [Aestuariivirga sp.]|nr:A/G-specific adenine glycosylase [Aestuariivirga sp.]